MRPRVHPANLQEEEDEAKSAPCYSPVSLLVGIEIPSLSVTFMHFLHFLSA